MVSFCGPPPCLLAPVVCPFLLLALSALLALWVLWVLWVPEFTEMYSVKIIPPTVVLALRLETPL